MGDKMVNENRMKELDLRFQDFGFLGDCASALGRTHKDCQYTETCDWCYEKYWDKIFDLMMEKGWTCSENCTMTSNILGKNVIKNKNCNYCMELIKAYIKEDFSTVFNELEQKNK